MARILLRVCAPNRAFVNVQLFGAAADSRPPKLPMKDHKGVWSACSMTPEHQILLVRFGASILPATAILDNFVTESPYSVDLARNGRKERLTDLTTASTQQPVGKNRVRRVCNLNTKHLRADILISAPTMPSRAVPSSRTRTWPREHTPTAEVISKRLAMPASGRHLFLAFISPH